MNLSDPASPVRGIGLCSGGLDSILSALVLSRQGIKVTFVTFETPFFNADAARKASARTGIPLIVKDITDPYLELLRAPRAGFGKNMNPCMDCHALMFSQAGDIMSRKGFDFLFSGEVMGQRPKSQTRNSLRYVEKNSGYQGRILRPLSALCLEPTPMEAEGLVDRTRLYGISGRSRKQQIEMARSFGVTDYPAPAGGCLLTDASFSKRLKDLMFVQKTFEKKELYLLKTGRHFRLDVHSKAIVGRSRKDNIYMRRYYDPDRDFLIYPERLAGPDVMVFGKVTKQGLDTASMICASYTRPDGRSSISVTTASPAGQACHDVTVHSLEKFRHLMI